MARSSEAGTDARVGEYLIAHARQDAVLADIDRANSQHPHASMQVSPDQGALLTVLVGAVKARNALEIGSFFGYSAICIARGLPPDGRLTCLEINPDYAHAAQINIDRAGLSDKVTIVLGPAEHSLSEMPATPSFDFVFMDADKQGYADYYELVLPRTKQGGLILIDNTLMSGRVLDPERPADRAVAELNDKIADDERVDSAMALIADGVTFVRKR